MKYNLINTFIMRCTVGKGTHYKVTRTYRDCNYYDIGTVLQDNVQYNIRIRLVVILLQ